MNGIQLTERLIQDVKQSIEIRNSVPDIHTQIKNISESGTDMGDFVGALNTISFDGHLRIVANLINIPSEDVVKYDPHNIEVFLNSLIEHREKIGQHIQNMLDNKDFVSLDDLKPVSEILIEKLNDLHEVSGKSMP